MCKCDNMFLCSVAKLTGNTFKWRQCHRCGKIYGRYEAKQETELTSLTEPGDNPFRFGNSKVLCVVDNRKFDRTGKRQQKKQFKQDLTQYKEDDIKDALRKGSKLVCYAESEGN
jgi:hypothetical protein